MIESGLYAFIANPDLIGCFCDRWLPECEQAARKIAATARDCGIPLEINTSDYNKPPKEDAGTGERRAQYPWEPFWKAVAESLRRCPGGSDDLDFSRNRDTKRTWPR